MEIVKASDDADDADDVGITTTGDTAAAGGATAVVASTVASAASFSASPIFSVEKRNVCLKRQPPPCRIQAAARLQRML
jgi:hypothetical protein